jgi:hypothetical protein
MILGIVAGLLLQADEVRPFLEKHCARCHGPSKQSGKLRLDRLNPDLAAGPDAERWNAVRMRLLAGEMPPEEEPQPPAADVQRAVDRLAAGLAKNPKVVLRAPPGLTGPAAGNRVDHQALFRPAPGTAPASPARLWRLSPYLYSQMAGELAQTRVIQPFTAGSSEGFLDYASLGGIDEPTTTQLLMNAEDIVEYQSTPNRRTGKILVRPAREFLELLEAPAATRPLMESAIRRQFHLVLLRGPSEEEVRRFVGLMERNVAVAGRERGVRDTLSAVLLLPEALFRSELGQGKPDASGRLRLAPREIAFALAYALTDRRPDAALLEAAASGRLATRDGVSAQVRRLLDDASIEKPRILRFFREYFGYDQAPEVFKNAEDFRDHYPEVLVSDTDRLVEHVLQADRDVLRTLLTTNLSFVGFEQTKNKRLPKKKTYLSYNLEATPEAQPVALPDRAGILTQPSWLVAWSQNTENHAILRGKWVRERLLGGTIPDLPITVNAQLPDEPSRTLRDRMDVTREPYCWNCHRKMNPLGLPFEGFDHFGRARKEELGKPVDTSGTVDHSGEAALDGAVASSTEMVKRLAGSTRVRQVFVRHAFRYWMGRNETLSDGPTLVDADRAYVDSGGSMKALIASLLASDSFLYRRP